MTSPKLIFFLMCLFLGTMAQTTDQISSSSVRQEKRFVSAKPGESVTLRCFYKASDTSWIYWYKQTLGQKPRLISSIYLYKARPTFYDEFENNLRFRLDSRNSSNQLTILNLHISDSATYYCAIFSKFVFDFAEGSFIDVRGSGVNTQPLVHQSVSEIIQPGGSVTLNCTVLTGSCDGEHSVYWFKNSKGTRRGLIYTHGGSSDQCERKPNTQTHTCDYNLPMKNLNLSHAGTYYCAVASCGHILFGNGTKLDFEEEVISLVYFLSGALAFNSILVVLLAFLVCKLNKRNNCQSTESEPRLSAPSTANTEGYRHADSLHYAAISVNVPNRARRQRNITNSECVYSGVKL
ncbi:immunoglobulin kappa light chain-like [Eleginops maclovinus]|uniref:immunoglobulin kappa light chain-like n=1 Tax=Eleginops maclovinus TaxID=56733 RepID=UPI00308049FB